jgi:hypothetical protein
MTSESQMAEKPSDALAGLSPEAKIRRRRLPAPILQPNLRTKSAVEHPSSSSESVWTPWMPRADQTGFLVLLRGSRQVRVCHPFYGRSS